MKKLLLLILSLVLIISLASCEILNFGTETTNPESSTTTTTQPITTRPTTTNPTTTNKVEDDPVEDKYDYNAFTASEKQIMKDVLGEVIPFIPNNEYYVETSAEDLDDGTSVVLISFYTLGNTKAEFEAYRSKFSSYTYDGTEEDEYGDLWYYYTSADGSYYVDLSYYYYEGDYVVYVYAYVYTESDNSDSGSGSGNTGVISYTAFTSDEKALLTRVVGTVIPFLANNEYYVEEYSYDYEDGSTEHGVNFYTYGNTKAEFDAYRALFSNYILSGTEVDEYGDTWYFYDAKDGSHYVDMSYYDTYEDGYVVDVYVYYLTEEGNSGSGSGSGSGGSSTPDNVITNDGAGLPNGTDGVYNVDFTKAENVKDVTDQGYYLDGCPTIGSPAVLVIPVQFSDEKASDKGYTIDTLVEAFAKDGKADYYSVYDYYYISSYGQLTLDITILDEWFTPKYDSQYYYQATYDYYGDQVEIGDQLIINEALDYLDDFMDLSQFDSDNNGIIDSIVLVNTLDVAEENFYWAYRYWNIYTDDDGYYYEYDGVSANDYVWASYQFIYEAYDEKGNLIYDSSVVNTYTFIHEFAHILGLDDYYDTAYVGAPLDGADMMDSMTGDHNAFSKFNLGWLTTSRLVTTDTSVTLTLEDFSKNGDTIILANNWDEKLGAYQEYYILVYYTNNGLNAGDEYGFFARDGIIVYHVNASLYKEDYYGDTYYDIYYNNTDSSDPYGYGTEENLIEFVKSGEDTFTYIVGSTFIGAYLDGGDKLGYTFTVDSLTSEYATITFTAQ